MLRSNAQSEDLAMMRSKGQAGNVAMLRCYQWCRWSMG